LFLAGFHRGFGGLIVHPRGAALLISVTAVSAMIFSTSSASLANGARATDVADGPETHLRDFRHFAFLQRRERRERHE